MIHDQFIINIIIFLTAGIAREAPNSKRAKFYNEYESKHVHCIHGILC